MVSFAAPMGTMHPPALPAKSAPVSLKRSSSYLEAATDAVRTSTPTKRLKVAFDPKINIHVMTEWMDKGFDLVREEVHLAVDRHLATGDARDDFHYSRLLTMLAQPPSSSEASTSALLQKHILAIDMRMNSLAECSKLAMAAVRVSWLGRSEDFVAVYLKFICDLASAHAKYLPAITESLVQYFAKLPASAGQLRDELQLSRSMMFKRLHAVIRALLQHTPSAGSSLMRAMKLLVPNDLESNRSYVQFLRNMFRVSVYAPELKYEIVVLITQRLVSMDVQIQEDLDEFEEDQEEAIFQRQTASLVRRDKGVDDTEDESGSETEESITEEEQRLRDVRLRAAKLDVTLDLLFEHYTPLIEDGSHPALNESFSQLLSHFTSFILPTRARHAQFVLFHFAQTSPNHSGMFVKHCLRLAGRDSGRGAYRLTALAYISSFVARGAHIPRSTVQEAVAILCQNLEDIRRQYEPTCRGPDRRAYALYYSVTQALLYIFCFRWRDLVIGSATSELNEDLFNEDDTIAEGGDLSWVSGFKETMMRNIYSRLNPLKVCSQAIVNEFAKIAHHLRFLYVFPLLETNKRIRLGHLGAYSGVAGVVEVGRRETAFDRKKGETHHQLEAYFPFDPYHLPQSKHWVSTDYNEWKLPLGMKQEDGDVYSDSEAGDDDDESDVDSIPDHIEDYALGETHSTSS